MSMVSFTQPKQLRRMAAHLLVAWVFALGTGIVNACLVQPHATTKSEIAAPGHGLHAEHGDDATAAANARRSAEDATPAAVAQATCAKFCADESAGVPAFKPATDPSSGGGLGLVASPQAAFVDVDVRVHLAPAHPPPTSRRVSLHIAYCRLAL